MDKVCKSDIGHDRSTFIRFRSTHNLRDGCTSSMGHRHDNLVSVSQITLFFHHTKALLTAQYDRSLVGFIALTFSPSLSSTFWLLSRNDFPKIKTTGKSYIKFYFVCIFVARMMDDQ